MKTILRLITRLIHFIATPEHDTLVLCAIPIEQNTHKRYFMTRQRAHTEYEHSNVAWRESIGEPK